MCKLRRRTQAVGIGQLEACHESITAEASLWLTGKLRQPEIGSAASWTKCQAWIIRKFTVSLQAKLWVRLRRA